MSAVATAIVGGSVVSGYFGNQAAGDAAGAQTDASMAGIEEQRRQFEALQKILSPYVQAGEGALSSQEDLMGLNGPQAQAKAIKQLQNSPLYSQLIQQGEEGILQNASATGGLRGGNIQNSLARFRPEVLNSLIDSQFNKLGSITSMGQNAAAGVGNAGMQAGANISNLYGDIGAANAGKYMAQSQAISGVADSASTYALLKNLKVF